MQGERPVIITPPDAPWLNKDQVFVVSGVSFELLAAGSTWRDYASTRELIHELRSPSTDLGADVRVAIHYRFLQPALDVTLLFLGLPLVVTRGNRNPFIAIGVCLAVVSAFMLVVLSCKSLGTSGWIPTDVCGVAAADDLCAACGGPGRAASGIGPRFLGNSICPPMATLVGPPREWDTHF